MAGTEGNLIGEIRLTVGRVTAIDRETLTIENPGGNIQQLTTSAQTGVVTASVGTADELSPGSRAVIKYKPGSQSDADEIVVLPSDSLRGLPIVGIEADAMTIKSIAGQSVRVNIDSVRIDHTAAATPNDLMVGSTAFIWARKLPAGGLVADEIIAFPGETAFGS